MPPINDNFANRIQIVGTGGGAVGHISGSNIGATAEVWEPSPAYSRSVWYEYSNPTHVDNGNIAMQFATIFNPKYGTPPDPVCDTSVRVYFSNDGSNTTGSLQEVSYSINTFNEHYAYYHQGSNVTFDNQFSQFDTSSYFIRVDGALGTQATASQGNFILWWNGYLPPKGADCTNCPPEPRCGVVCQGVQCLDVTNNHTSSFGTFPSGSYIMKYCGGCLQFGLDGDPEQWTAYFTKTIFGSSSFSSGSNLYYDWSFFSSGSKVTQSMYSLFQVNDLDALSRDFHTQQECVEYFGSLPCEYQFAHSGGDISLYFGDSHIPGNFNGNPSPVFGLYSVTFVPNITASAACVNWITPGVRAVGVFTVTNTGPHDAVNLTVALDSTGGVSNSQVINNVDLPSNIPTPITIEFDIASQEAVATLRVSTPKFDCATKAVVFNLAPLISITTVPTIVGPSSHTFCSVDEMQHWEAKNSGLWAITASVTMSFDNPNVQIYLGQDSTNHICIPATVAYDTIQFGCAETSAHSFFFPITSFIADTSHLGNPNNVYITMNDQLGHNVFENVYQFNFPG